MGVIHKLTDDIKSAILEAKKLNPKLSVRKIAEQVSAQFDKNISKSSVSSILKEAQLSSAVGRRTKSPSKKKFTIPKEKKEQLFSAEDPLLKEIKEKAAQKPKPKQEEPPKKSEPSVESIREDRVEGLLPDPMAKKNLEQNTEEENNPPVIQHQEEFILKVKQKKQAIKNLEIQNVKQSGFIFQKALESELFSKNVLQDVLFKNEERNAAMLSNLAKTYAQLRSINAIVDDDIVNFDQHGPVVFNDITKEQLGTKALTIIKSVELNSMAGFELQNSIMQSLQWISQTKIVFEDGSDFEFNALANNVVSNNEVALFEKTLSLVSKNIVANNDPVWIVKNVDNDLNTGLGDLLVKFDQGVGIKSVLFFDEDSREIFKFSAVPKRAREFICFVSAKDKLIDKLHEQIKWAEQKSYYDEVQDSIMSYTVVKSKILHEHFNFNSKELCFLIVFDEAQKVAGVLIGNMIESKMVKQLQSYLSKIDSKGTLNQSFDFEIDEEEIKNNLGVVEFLAFYQSIMHELTLKRFFSDAICGIPIESFKEGCLDLEGAVYKSEKLLICTLDMSNAKTSFEWVNYAAKKLNKACIKDEKGRIIVVKLR